MSCRFIHSWLLLLALHVCLGVGGFSRLFAQDQASITAVGLADRKSPLGLDGPWEFYWQQLLAPGDSLPPNSLFLKKAQAWSHIRMADGSTLPNMGYGTYRTIVTDLPSRPEGYVLSLANFKSAAKVYIYPSDRPEEASSVEVGRVGKSIVDSLPSQNIIFLPFFPQNEQKSWTILVQGSNYANHEAGFFLYPPYLGTDAVIHRTRQLEQATSLYTLGILTVVSLYSLMMFARHRLDMASLMLSFLCFFVALRTLGMNDFLNYYLEADSYLLYVSQIKMEYLAILLGPLAYICFLHYTFPQYSSRWILILSAIYNLTMTLFIVATPPVVFQKLLTVYQMFLLLQVLWIPVVMGRALRNKAPGVYLVLIGAVSCCGAAVWDVLVAKQVFSGYFMMQYAVAIFMISQSEVVAQRAALAFRKSRQLAKDLKFEMQARVMMVSDLAHRTNNPLNYITTGVNSLRQEVIEQHQDIQELFANLDRNDPDNLAVINHFDQKYRAMLEAIDSMSHGVQRSANSVTEIRTMSGVDGYSLVPVLWKDVLLAAKLRLKENIGYKADCLYLKTDEVEDLQVRSNATALTLALELIFRLWVGRALHDVVVSFRQEGNAQREFCKIYMECAWNDHAADDTDKEQVENLAYIIQPYGCSLELSEDLKRISFRFELTTKTVALADAS